MTIRTLVYRLEFKIKWPLLLKVIAFEFVLYVNWSFIRIQSKFNPSTYFVPYMKYSPFEFYHRKWNMFLKLIKCHEILLCFSIVYLGYNSSASTSFIRKANRVANFPVTTSQRFFPNVNPFLWVADTILRC